MCASSLFCADAQKSEQDQKKQLEIVHVSGNLRIVPSACHVMTFKDFKEANMIKIFDHAAVLKNIYDLNDDDSVIFIEYLSPESFDWARHGHPRLGRQLHVDTRLGEWLPVTKSIGMQSAQAVSSENWLKDNNIPKPLAKLITNYAFADSLLEVEQGEKIKIRLPIEGIDARAELYCDYARDGSAPFHIALRKGLLKHNIPLSDELRQCLQQEVDDYNAKLKDKS